MPPPSDSRQKFNFNFIASKTASCESNTFPAFVINGAAKRFTDEYSSRLEVPPEFLYLSYLTCLGSVIANRITIKTEIRPQPRLYTLLLGESADVRKSTAISKTVDFFDYALKAVDPERPPEFIDCWGVGSAEGLAKFLQTGPTKSVILCYDEFKSFISKSKIKTSTLLECVNSLFESNRYENHISKSKIVIRNGYLSLLAASTVQTYEATWDRSFTDIGFSNRLFIVPGSGSKKYVLPPAIPIREMQSLVADLLSIIDTIGTKKEITIEDGAHQILQSWYQNMPTSVHNKRLDGYALRLLILMAANLEVDTINEIMVQNVIALADWQFEMRKQYDPIDADNEMARLEEKIRRLLQQPGKVLLSERELKQYTNAHRTGLWLFSNALSNLRTSEEIVLDKRSRKWRLNC